MKSIIHALGCFVGKKIVACIDDIECIADLWGYYLNLMDPVYNTHSIDKDSKRLNIHTKDGIITSFTIG